ncbi:hypothetical protein B0H14DRAFT_2816664, partial [Mycena olivaceomarginata]
IRSWGLYPYIPRGQQGAGHEDIPYPMMRKMMHQMTYAPLNRSSQLLRPEDQFMNAVLARRKRELKQVNLGDLTRRDYVLRIHMPDIKTAAGEARIWRRFIVSGGMSLGVFSGQSFGAAMGWCACPFQSIWHFASPLLPGNSGAIDMMHIDADDYCVAHVMDEINFRHDIIVEKIVPLEESYGRVQIYSMPTYTDRGWNKASKFDPDYFDLAETTQAVMAALGTKLSYSPGAKTFKVPFAPEALLGPLSASKRKTTREVTMSPGDSFGFYEELKKDGRDSRRATACAACGNPNDLKACSGCGQRFYCGQACQKVRLHCSWKSTHKQECAMAKKKHASG